MFKRDFIERLSFICSLIIITILLDYFYHDLKLDIFFIGISMLFPLSKFVEKTNDRKMRETVLPMAGQVIFLYIYLFYALPLMFVINKFISVNPNYIWGAYIILAVVSHIINVKFRVKTYNIKSNKIKISKKIVFFSDLHLNEFSRSERIRKLIDRVNSLEADYLINGGDLVDSYFDFIPEEVTKELKKLQYKKKYIGVMGNHEHHGGAEKNRTYLKELGMELLEESVVESDDFVFFGRENYEKDRQALMDFSKYSEKFIINIDHTPSEFKQSLEKGVDLNISGHTHGGQFFPVNFAYMLLYPMLYGYRKVGNLHIIVSSGVGTSFIPFRNIFRPEIVVLEITSS